MIDTSVSLAGRGFSRTQQTFIRRLLGLARFLENLPPYRFNFSTWAGNDDTPFGGKQDLSCGTTACALGWAITFPWAQKLGVRLVPDTINGVRAAIKFADYHVHAADEKAAEAMFGTERKEFFQLFTPGEPIPWREPIDMWQTAFWLSRQATAKEVAHNIRGYVTHKYGVLSKGPLGSSDKR
jgi:hypothetical protein